MNLLTLIYEFLKTGLFSIGGGLATMPFLYAMADKYPWFTRELLIDMIAVSESTPGPIGINMATFAGFKAGGVPGGVIASFAIILPSIIIMSFIVRALAKFKESRFVKYAFYGLRPAVTALVMWAGLGFAAVTLVTLTPFAVNIKQVLLLVILIAITRFYKKIQPVWLIAAAAVVGAVLKF